jgi:hypothetical protein
MLRGAHTGLLPNVCHAGWNLYKPGQRPEQLRHMRKRVSDRKHLLSRCSGHRGQQQLLSSKHGQRDSLPLHDDDGWQAGLRAGSACDCRQKLRGRPTTLHFGDVLRRRRRDSGVRAAVLRMTRYQRSGGFDDVEASRISG